MLTGELALADVILSVEGKPNLSLLPAGPGSHRAADLIGPRLSTLLDEFAKEYDLVILDSPPLLGFAECLQMASAADGVLIVSRAGETRRKAVAEVISRTLPPARQYRRRGPQPGNPQHVSRWLLILRVSPLRLRAETGMTFVGIYETLQLRKVRDALTLRPFDVELPGGRSKERYRKLLLTAITGPMTSGSSFLTFLITVPLTIRYLGPERYGAWMSISALMAFLRFSDLGLGNGLVGAISQAEGRDDRLYTQRAISSVLVCLLISGAFISCRTFQYLLVIHRCRPGFSKPEGSA